MYDFKNNRKGTVRPGFRDRPLRGIDDMLMSPPEIRARPLGHGRDGQTCHMQAYDTSMAYVGQVLCGRGHYDLTVDKDGSDGRHARPTRAVVHRGVPRQVPDPDGATAPPPVTARLREALRVQRSHGGGHVSGRAYGLASSF